MTTPQGMLELGYVTDGDGATLDDEAIIFFVGDDGSSDIKVSAPNARNARNIAERLVKLWNASQAAAPQGREALEIIAQCAAVADKDILEQSERLDGTTMQTVRLADGSEIVRAQVDSRREEIARIVSQFISNDVLGVKSYRCADAILARSGGRA